MLLLLLQLVRMALLILTVKLLLLLIVLMRLLNRCWKSQFGDSFTTVIAAAVMFEECP